MTTVIVSNVIANKPWNGGNVWASLNWVVGLRRLGVNVYFVEQIAPTTCVDARGKPAAFADSINLAYFRKAIERFGLEGAAALVYDEGAETDGLTYAELLDLAGSADLLLNVSGHLTHEPLLRRLGRRAYVDLDPGYTQFWQEGGAAGSRLEGHDRYYTVGAEVGTPSCPIPTCGLSWRPIRPPVVLDLCPVAAPTDPGRFTTVASWRGAYGRVQQGDRLFGQKAHEFRKFLGLPGRARQTFEIALDIHPADEAERVALVEHGWRVLDPKVVAADADGFQRYVQGSGAEFSVAQGIYVETRSGWFSDRTCHYLASGKPALVQDTGFGRRYPVGEGLIPFETMDEAVEGARRIAGDYHAHCQAARELAVRYFDSDKVLGGLLDDLGLAG